MIARGLPIEVYTSTTGGSLPGIMAAISLGDVAETLVIAIIGTVVSFFVSLVLKWLVSRNNAMKTRSSGQKNGVNGER